MAAVEINQDKYVLYVTARGGSRRERGAAIGAVVRRMRREGAGLQRGSTGYSETYGFNTGTYARYLKV